MTVVGISIMRVVGDEMHMVVSNRCIYSTLSMEFWLCFRQFVVRLDASLLHIIHRINTYMRKTYPEEFLGQNNENFPVDLSKELSEKFPEDLTNSPMDSCRSVYKKSRRIS